MPYRLCTLSLTLALCLGLSLPARADDAPAPAAPAASRLDAPLFYQLLIGELEAQRGELGTAYQVLLDAARRTGDEGLYQRVIGIALQARAGSEAYAAARDWAQQSDSLAAHQHVARLAVALGRLDEAGPALVDWLRLLPGTQERAGLLSALPQLLRNVGERERPLNDMEPALALIRDRAERPQNRLLAASVLAALALHAGNEVLALNQLDEAHRLQPEDALPAWQALELMRLRPDAERLVLPLLEGDLALHGAYARALARDHRTQPALEQFQRLRQREPAQGAHAYALGSLWLDLRQPQQALGAIDEYLASLPAQGAAEQRKAGLLLKAQALAQLRQGPAALQALEAIEGGETQFEVVYRRAAIEAQQGQLAQARKRLQALPADGPEQRERRLLAEVQLLRDANQWAASFDLLTQALKESPADADLLYEHAMSAERTGRFALMEQQLRRVIELNPRHHHAHNALGYALADRNERLDEARTLIERAIELAGPEPFFVDSLGWVAFREGRLDEAERWLRQAHRARPDAEIAAHLAELLWKQGKADEAGALMREAAQREPDNAAVKAARKRLGL